MARGDGTPRTVVLLTVKRSGSTAVFRMFQRHPGAGVAHADQSIPNWEPNFWNQAASALRGDGAGYVERQRGAFPFLPAAAPSCAREAFEAWDRVLDRLGPVVFDKTGYLAHPEGLRLLLRYRDAGRDVRLIGLVRDPRDVIVSQLERLGYMGEDSPARRARLWVERYERLEALRAAAFVPVFRHEDLVRAPDVYAPMMLDYAGLAPVASCWDHLAPVGAGRGRGSLAGWDPDGAMRALMDRYGYGAPRRGPIVS